MGFKIRRISLPRLCVCHHPQFATLAEIITLCDQQDLGIELSAFSDIEAVENPDSTAIYRAHCYRGLYQSLHGPYLDLYPGHPDKRVRDLTLQHFARVSEVAGTLGIRHIIFHHNYDPRASSKSVWLDLATTFWKTYLARNPGLRIHLENVMDEDPQLIDSLVESVDSPAFDVALDIGHVFCYSKASLTQWISRLGSKIGYVHLHDNHGRADEHLALGQGSIPLIQTLDQLRCEALNAIWSVESGGPKTCQSVQWLRTRGYI
jgi:sugar phosphate isomerase/epimerase